MRSQHNSTWVKAPDTQLRVVDDTRTGATKGVYDAASPNLQGREAVDTLSTKRAILTPNTVMTVGCWNTRTLYSAGATQLLIQELNRFRWDIVGLSETHWTGTDDKMHGSIRILSCGREDLHSSGVAIALNAAAQTALIEYNPVCDRIIAARFKTSIGTLVICQIYAPTADSSEEDIDAFYTSLQTVLNSTKKSEIVVLMGDFNAKVGKSEGEVGGPVGRFGYGKRNTRGERLVNFCAANGLYVTNTLFRQWKENRCWTWESPDGVTRNQIDFVIVNRKCRGSVLNSRAYPSADIGSDHQLLLANLRLKLKRSMKPVRSGKVDISRLRIKEVKEEYQRRMELSWEEMLKEGSSKIMDYNIEDAWRDVKENFVNTAKEVIGLSKPSRAACWLSTETEQLAKNRREAKKDRHKNQMAAKHHNFLCRQVRKSAKKDQEAYISRICDNIERSHQTNKSRLVYEGIRRITGISASRVAVVKDDKEVLITESTGVKDRWKSYFQGLYNDPNPVRDDDLPDLPLFPNTDHIPSIGLDEVREAIHKLKHGKAVGYDNIGAEELQAATEKSGLIIMHGLLQSAWNGEKVPRDWKKAIIIPIHKKKDKLLCENYRGVSLLCHTSKIYTQIILNRMRKRTEEILSEEQAGFRANRSTIDQIFTLRQLCEKHFEMRRDLFLGYIDFRKAFDSVWRQGLWRVLRYMGYPEKIVRILENLYEGTFSAVRTNGELSEWFETGVGVMQGCVLSPLLFNIFLELIICRSLADVEVGVMIGGTIISNLRFADDIAATADTAQALQVIMESIAAEARRMGMKINTDKTQVQHIGKEGSDIHISIDGGPLEQVDDFIYLGGTISRDGSVEQDIKRRIGLASGVMRNLTRVWRAKELGIGTKKKIYEVLVLSVLLYNAETWTLKKSDTHRLLVFEMSCLRKIAGVSLREHQRNTEIRERLGMQLDITERVRRKRLQYFGHVSRMPSCRYPLIALHGGVTGSRGRGRPRKRWIDAVREDAIKVGVSLPELSLATQERTVWRSLVMELSTRARASP
jgi:hypothetical protein